MRAKGNTFFMGKMSNLLSQKFLGKMFLLANKMFPPPCDAIPGEAADASAAVRIRFQFSKIVVADDQIRTEAGNGRP